MAGWKWYIDAACTTEFGGTLQYSHLADLSDNPTDNTLWYGNVDDDPGDNQVLKQEDQATPGTDPITVSVVDSAVGSGHEADEVTFALSAAALDTNTAGASLGIGTTLLSGVSQAVAVHVRVENAVTGPGTSTELQLSITPTVDSAV